jgi:FkbM family methyltransferase
MFIDLEDKSVAPHLIQDGYWESWISLAMARNLRPGMNVVDVGANFGYYTMLMSEAVGPEGRVLACEPMLDYANKIKRTCQINDVTNVLFCVQAIADTFEDLVEMRIPGDLKGSTSMVLYNHPNVAKYYNKEGFFVYTNTIDILTEDWPSVDFVKIDVEGAEQMVWRGMSKTLEENRDIGVFMEVAKDRFDLNDFLDEIEHDGFTISLVDTDGSINRASRSDIFAEDLDMLAIRRDALAWTMIEPKALQNRLGY